MVMLTLHIIVVNSSARITVNVMMLKKTHTVCDSSCADDGRNT